MDDWQLTGMPLSTTLKSIDYNVAMTFILNNNNNNNANDCFAGEMIDKMTIMYNRQRQAVITNELVEIISGAAALK